MKQKTGIKQGTEMILILKQSQGMDMVDAQSCVYGVEATAEMLIKKYGNNLSAIEKEVSEISVSKEMGALKGFNFKEEILWSARWILRGSGDYCEDIK